MSAAEQAALIGRHCVVVDAKSTEALALWEGVHGVVVLDPSSGQCRFRPFSQVDRTLAMSSDDRDAVIVELA